MAHPDAPSPMHAHPSGALSGTVDVPGDKSVSHRALMLGAMAVGETRITGLLEGEDVLATAAAMRAFGAEVTRTGEGAWSVHGVGVGGLMEPEDVIDCGNAGTGVRLIMGLMATSPISVTFTGDASLRRRPMGRVLDPLARIGARAWGRRGGLLPLTLGGAAEPVPIDYAPPMASAQVKSAVLLAGLNAPGETVVREVAPTRDHTERMLRGFGATVEVDGTTVRVMGQPELSPQTVSVPRDPSSAAFPIAAALIVPGSWVRVPGVSLNPTRAGLLDTLRDMGADLTLEHEREEGGEPVADIVVAHGPLRGVEVSPERAPAMIDEYPVLAAIAAFAEGRTVMNGIGELRVKESDRIAATAQMLRAAGVVVEEAEEGMTVEGRGADGVVGGGTVETRLDHRIAMSALVLGLGARDGLTVDDAGPIATSFPGFLALMEALGARIDAPVPA